MRIFSYLFPKTLTGKTLWSFSIFALILISLGIAFFQYQRSLFDPRQFNQQLIERSIFAVSLFDRLPNANGNDNRVRQALGTVSLTVLPKSSKFSQQGNFEKLDDLNFPQRQFLRDLERGILKRDSNHQTRRGNRGINRPPFPFKTKKRSVEISVVEISDELIEALEEQQEKTQLRRQNRNELRQIPNFNRDDDDEADDHRAFRPRRFEENRSRLGRALKRPVVLLTFETAQSTSRQMLIMPAFTNYRFVGVLIGLFLAVLFLAATLTIYAIGTITKPLARLTQSARKFGQSLQPEQIETKGHSEVSEAIDAFNGMQGQVRGLVDERTRIIGAVSHDLRTHLTRIRLRMELLSDFSQGNEAALKHATKTIADLEEMEGILVSSLEYSRHSTGEGERLIEEVDLCDLVPTLTAAYMPPIPTEIASSSPLLVAIDTTAIKRALNNLMSNAERHAQNPTVRVFEQNKRAVIEICDTGPGIPTEERQKVLEPFYRIEHSRNRNTGGSGLGLSITHEIVRNHGGSLEFLDRDDQQTGLCVRLVLPLSH